jgi:hypothetical protein
MASQQTPLASPWPPPIRGDILTESQWATLMAIGDTVIASIDSSSPSANKLSLPPPKYDSLVQELKDILPPSTDEGLICSYLAENASSIPQLRAILQRVLSDNVRPDKQKAIVSLLSILE